MNIKPPEKKLHPFAGFLAITILLSMALTPLASAATPPLTISANGRMLVQSNGTPFFWMGDTNWRLYKLSGSEILAYMQDRKSKGFNVIQGPLVLPGMGGAEFTSADGHTSINPNQPNQGWFSDIDFIVQTADNLGLYIALVVTWGDTWDVFGTQAKANNFGKFLGQRYRNRNNVIWVVAGEFNIEGTGSNISGVWDSLARGIKQGSGDRQLVTIHPSFQSGRQSSATFFHNAPWLDFNMTHSSQSGDSGSGANNWALVNEAFRKSPAKPVIDAEANYEQLGGWDAHGVRRRAYWSVFAGAFGHTYGANGVWQSLRSVDQPEAGAVETWDQALDFEGASDMRHLRRLIESRPMLRRVPAQNTLETPAGGVPNHVRATRDRSGRWLMVYVPQSSTTFKVKMDFISSDRAKAWWYNPRTGASRLIGTFNASGTRQFKSPGSGPDWVLVLDDPTKNYRAPGKGGPIR